MRTCDCCGHPLPDTDIGAHLTRMQRRIFDKVLKSGTGGIETKDLFEFIYADDPNGGPLDTGIIAVVANNIRKRLEPHGLTTGASRGPGSRYTVTNIQPKGATHARA